MEQQARDERNKRLRINIIFLVVAIILSFYFVQLRFTANIRMTHASAVKLAQGVAWTPYQYRALIPWFVSFLVRLPFVRPDATIGVYRLTEFILLLALVISFRYYLSFFFRSLLVSFFGTLKTELVHHSAYRTREEAKNDIFFYIEDFYNRRRRHSALGYLSPVDFELVHHGQSMLAYCPQN